MPDSRYFEPRRPRRLRQSSFWPGRFAPARRKVAPPQAVLDALERAASPADEIDALTACERERDRKLVLARKLSHPPPTLADLGRRHSVARTRVGQVVQRFAARAAQWSVSLPRCEDALGALDARNGILPFSERESALGESVECLVAATEFGFLSAPVERDDRLRAWMSSAGRRRASEYGPRLAPRLREIGGQRRAWGAFELALLPPFAPVPLEQRILLTLPERVGCSDFRVAGDLVVFARIGAPLDKRIRKILAALGPIGLRDLREGIRIERRPVPAVHQLRDIIVHSSSPFRVDDRDVVSSGEELDPREALASDERLALAIFQEAGGVVDRGWYIHRMTGGGVRPPRASALLRSPFFVHHRRGVYGLLGAEPSPGQIRAAADADAIRLRDSLTDVELRADSAVLRYRIAVASQRVGTLPLPPDLRLPTGSWPTYFPDDSLGALSVGSGAVGGLRAWMLEQGVGAGDTLVIEIDIDARVMHVLLDGGHAVWPS